MSCLEKEAYIFWVSNKTLIYFQKKQKHAEKISIFLGSFAKSIF